MKYTAKTVEEMADLVSKSEVCHATGMLRELASRLRQDEEEAKRDVAKEPRPGDRIEFKDGTCKVFFEEYDESSGGCTSYTWWQTEAAKGATIIRRREVGR